MRLWLVVFFAITIDLFAERHDDAAVAHGDLAAIGN
jgi:hypothetical protein